jgi:hypothetical protein
VPWIEPRPRVLDCNTIRVPDNELHRHLHLHFHVLLDFYGISDAFPHYLPLCNCDANPSYGGVHRPV